jgi:hypothetical protein
MLRRDTRLAPDSGLAFVLNIKINELQNWQKDGDACAKHAELLCFKAGHNRYQDYRFNKSADFL